MTATGVYRRAMPGIQRPDEQSQSVNRGISRVSSNISLGHAVRGPPSLIKVAVGQMVGRRHHSRHKSAALCRKRT